MKTLTKNILIELIYECIGDEFQSGYSKLAQNIKNDSILLEESLNKGVYYVFNDCSECKAGLLSLN